MPQHEFPFLKNPSFDFDVDSRASTHWQQWGRQSHAIRHLLAYAQYCGNGEFVPMAKQARKNTSFGIDFVTIELSEKQEKEFTAWVSESTSSLPTLVGELASSGHKIGVSFDGDNECFIVSVTCKDESQDNHNLCYTSRSDEWLEALQLAVFKWDVISKRGKWLAKTQRKNWG